MVSARSRLIARADSYLPADARPTRKLGASRTYDWRNSDWTVGDGQEESGETGLWSLRRIDHECDLAYCRNSRLAKVKSIVLRTSSSAKLSAKFSTKNERESQLSRLHFHVIEVKMQLSAKLKAILTKRDVLAKSRRRSVTHEISI